MTEENLLNHIIMRLSPQVMDYVEVRNSTTKALLLQLVEKQWDDGVVETYRLNGEGSRAEEVENKGSKGLAREKSTREKQCRGKRMMSEKSTESCNNKERRRQSKRSSPGRLKWRKCSATSSLDKNTEVQRRPNESSFLGVNGVKNANMECTMDRNCCKNNSRSSESGDNMIVSVTLNHS
ncbi:hypothetical protein NPIL_677961 [Nephila pilipes]|uniref:Uncharacterized protein n=1 Tax=Nephila pilipes TaxID=299642 RepID=A0A8X6PHS6_NEPPI|nr:hypothetical protein NPIL_677961 [Nephila pilipes]